MTAETTHKSTRRRASRKYAFAVVSLAVFGLAFAAGHPAVKGYVASTIIEFSPTAAKSGSAGDAIEGSGTPAAALRTLLISDSLLGEAAVVVSSRGPGTDPTETLQRYVREGLEVQPGARPDEFVITLNGADRSVPLAMLNELAARIAAVPASPSGAGDEQEKTRLAEVRDAARREVERHQASIREWEQRRDRHRAARPQPAPVVAPPPSPPPQPPRENPHWNELAQLLDQLRGRRLTLLVERLPAHPEVQDVQLRMDEIERQLATTPRFVPMAEPPVLAPEPPASERSDVQAEYARTEAALTAEGKRLHRELESARAELTAATAAWEQAPAGREPALAYRVRVIQGAEIVGVVGGVPRGMALIAMALFGSVAGLVASRLVSASRTIDVFTTTDEIARTLGLPVIGAISTGDGPAIPAAASPGRLVPIGLRMCELALAGFAVLTVAGGLTDGVTGRLLLRSPLQAFALACERFLPL